MVSLWSHTAPVVVAEASGGDIATRQARESPEEALDLRIAMGDELAVAGLTSGVS